ncbi:hypothetical protein VTK73DRAFT_8206 [Phialemonium thermophilum]|uniref:Uncharacterized protein n=1 Tax=Phialemonium thermophilum TaxID=223376 RepID=A0ABR3W9X9_9PEZI
MRCTSSTDSGASVKVRHRLRSAACTLKLGFSVVAPINVMVPASTGRRNTSCCDLEKRWISSQNMMVFLPVKVNSLAASANSFLHSVTPVLVALISMKRLPTRLAMQRAIVVFPVPEPPHRIIDGTLSASIRLRRTPWGPTRSCPKTSSSDCGRILSASGAALLVLDRFGRGASSVDTGPCGGLDPSSFAVPLAFCSAGESWPGPSSKLLLIPLALSDTPFVMGVRTL